MFANKQTINKKIRRTKRIRRKLFLSCARLSVSHRIPCWHLLDEGNSQPMAEHKKGITSIRSAQENLRAVRQHQHVITHVWADVVWLVISWSYRSWSWLAHKEFFHFSSQFSFSLSKWKKTYEKWIPCELTASHWLVRSQTFINKELFYKSSIHQRIRKELNAGLKIK